MCLLTQMKAMIAMAAEPACARARAFVWKLQLPLVASKDACILAGSRVYAALPVRETRCVRGPIELHRTLKLCTPECAHGNVHVKEP